MPWRPDFSVSETLSSLVLVLCSGCREVLSRKIDGFDRNPVEGLAHDRPPVAHTDIRRRNSTSINLPSRRSSHTHSCNLLKRNHDSILLTLREQRNERST